MQKHMLNGLLCVIDYSRVQGRLWLYDNDLSDHILSHLHFFWPYHQRISAYDTGSHKLVTQAYFYITKIVKLMFTCKSIQMKYSLCYQVQKWTLHSMSKLQTWTFRPLFILQSFTISP